MAVKDLADFVKFVDASTFRQSEIPSCTMNGSLIAWFTVETFLLSIHVSVALCILCQRLRRISIFMSDFFALYLVQAVADVSSYFLVSTQKRPIRSFRKRILGASVVQTVTFVRLARLGYFSRELYATFGTTGNFMLALAHNVQFLCLVAIAVNRYCALSKAASGKVGDPFLREVLSSQPGDGSNVVEFSFRLRKT